MTVKERMERIPVSEWGRVDLRAYLKKRLQEEGITAYRLAQIMAISRSALINGLNGKIPIPLERMEQILWLLDGEDLLTRGAINATDIAIKVAEQLRNMNEGGETR